MRGTQEPTPQEPLDGADTGGQAASWRSVLFMPVTFPITVGGTSFAILVGFRSRAENVSEVVALSIAGIAYAAVAGITVYLSGQVERRTSPRAQMLLERIAGILLTAIAVSLLVSGGTQMVVAALESLKH
jgi:multiple antibiotic resistance protein